MSSLVARTIVREMSADVPTEAMSAYRWALLGRSRKAGELLGSLLERASEGESAGAVLLISGMCERLRGNLTEAAVKLLKAAQQLGDSALRPLAETTLLETSLSLGRAEVARRRLTEIAAAIRPGVLLNLRAALLCSEGEFSEGFRLWKTAELLPADSTAGRWMLVLEAEAHLDHAQAEPALARCNAVLAADVFDEPFLRAKATRALILACFAGEKFAPRAQAAEAVTSAARYCVNVDRYATWAQAADALLELAPNRILEACDRLSSLGLPWDEARLSALGASVMQRREREQRAPLGARAREGFARVKAPGRLRKLDEASKDSGGQPGAPSPEASIMASMMGGASMMRSQMLEQLKGKGTSRALQGGDQQNFDLEQIFELSRLLNSSLSLEQTLERALQVILRSLKAERAVVLRREPNGELTCVASKGVAMELIRPQTQEISFSMLKAAEKQNAVIMSQNAHVDDRFSAQASVIASQIRSAICGPLRTAHGLYGFLYADSRITTQAFREFHKELFQLFSSQCAVALENALNFGKLEAFNRELEGRVEARTQELSQKNEELSRSIAELKSTRLALAESQRDALEKELVLARRIQQMSLPTLDPSNTSGLRISGKLEAAFYCGGDTWGSFPLPDGSTLLFIADATGHGVGAGMIAGVAQAAVNMYTRMNATMDLVALADNLNQLLLQTSKKEIMLTALLGRVEPRARTLELVSAGHEPPLKVDQADGLPRIQPVPVSGIHLGKEPDSRYEKISVPLVPGEKLVLYTDGLTECANPAGKMWGLKGVTAALSHLAREPVDAMVEGLFRMAKEHMAGRPPDDDITAICVEVLDG